MNIKKIFSIVAIIAIAICSTVVPAYAAGVSFSGGTTESDVVTFALTVSDSTPFSKVQGSFIPTNGEIVSMSTSTGNMTRNGNSFVVNSNAASYTVYVKCRIDEGSSNMSLAYKSLIATNSDGSSIGVKSSGSAVANVVTTTKQQPTKPSADESTTKGKPTTTSKNKKDDLTKDNTTTTTEETTTEEETSDESTTEDSSTTTKKETTTKIEVVWPTNNGNDKGGKAFPKINFKYLVVVAIAVLVAFLGSLGATILIGKKKQAKNADFDDFELTVDDGPVELDESTIDKSERQ